MRGGQFPARAHHESSVKIRPVERRYAASTGTNQPGLSAPCLRIVCPFRGRGARGHR